MIDLIREAPLGQFLNYASKGRLLPYPEERADYVVPEKYRLHPTEVTGVGDSDPTLVGTQSQARSKNRNSLARSSPASIYSGYPPTTASETYNSRILGEKVKEGGRRNSRQFRELDLEDGGQIRNETHEPRGPPSRAGSNRSVGNSSMDTQMREKREREHWTQRMLKDPKIAKLEGLEDDADYLVRWNGPDDPDNPQNFSRVKKLFISFQICLMTFSVYLGASLITSSETGLQEEFGIGRTVSVLSLSLYILGYGIGPMLWSPLQEIPHFGRMPVFVSCMFVFVAFQIPIVLAKNYATVLVFRFLTGFFGAPPLSGGGAALCDLYDSLHVPYALGVWAMAAVCGPILSPVIGGFAAMNLNWRWPIYELIFASAFSLAFSFLLLPETYGPTILYRRARRLRKLTGNDKLITREELDLQDEPSIFTTIGTTISRAFLLCADPIVLFCNLYLGFVYAIFYLWFEAFPIVFTEYRGFNLGVSGLPFLAFYVTGALSFLVYCLYQKYHYIPKIKKTDFNVPPEERLELALMGAPFVGVALLLFGWLGNYKEINWIGPTIGASLYFPGVYAMFQCLSVYLALSYEKYAASILAGSALFRSALGAGFPLFGHAFFSNLGVGPGSSLLAGISFLLIIPLWFLYKNGARLRSKSRWIEE
ncbi:hypothetical protein JCM3765_001512 [Sporobolomyces pararoseus]